MCQLQTPVFPGKWLVLGILSGDFLRVRGRMLPLHPTLQTLRRTHLPTLRSPLPPLKPLLRRHLRRRLFIEKGPVSPLRRRLSPLHCLRLHLVRPRLPQVERRLCQTVSLEVLRERQGMFPLCSRLSHLSGRPLCRLSSWLYTAGRGLRSPVSYRTVL